MKLSNFLQSSSNAKGENRVLKFAIVVMAIVSFGSMITSYMALKYTKTILVFPGAVQEEQMLISGNTVNGPYLRWFSRYVLTLLADFTPETIDTQYQELLTVCSPGFHSTFQPQIDDMVQRVKTMGVSSLFVPKGSIKLDTKARSIEITGLRQRYASGTMLESNQMVYVITYKLQDGRIMVDGLSEKK